MLIVHQNGLFVYNVELVARVGIDYDDKSKIPMIISLPVYIESARRTVSFQVGTFSNEKNYQKCLDKLIDAYANGEKVFRVPKEEELTDDNG